MNLIELQELKEGDIIYHKRGEELELKYSGWNNGHIWDFYKLEFKDDEDMDGYFGEQIVRLTKGELKDWFTR